MWALLSIFQILFIALWTIVNALWMVPAILMGGSRLAMWAAGEVWSFGLLWLCGVKVDVRNRHLSHEHAPCIYVANHSSHFDIPALFFLSRVPLYFVAKKELKKIPLFGTVLTLIGMILIDRSNRADAMRSMRAAGMKIRSGKHVVTFPEGTRSSTGEVGIFKRGSFIMALAGDVPVVPVAITGSRDVLKKGSYTIKPGRITVTYGEPLYPSNFESSDPDSFANEARRQVIELMKQ